MSGVSERALAQVLHCKSSFEALGYDVIICEGLKTSEQPPAGSGCRTSVTWGAVALPKIVSLLERQGAGRSDLFILCEESCQPTKECAPVHLTALVRPEENVWFGAARSFEKRKITSVISEDWNVINENSEVMAPAGSKMFVCGIDFLRLWINMYRQSPTAWSVDYHNQVLVASGLLRVEFPFLAGNHYPHYSQRTHKWTHDGDDPKCVQLRSSPLEKMDVVFTAMRAYRSEGGGYLQVHARAQIRLLTGILFPAEDQNVYSGAYAYGVLCHSSREGWFPFEILGDVRTQLETVGAIVI